MRQKKSNFIYYILGLIFLAAVVFAVVHEVQMPVEHIEVELPLAQ